MPHQVNLTRNVWGGGADADGGRRVKSSTSVSGVSAFAQPGRATTIIATSDEGGLRRVTELTPTMIFFVDDQQLKIDDLIYWLDPATNIGHNYLVIGWQPPCGSGQLWVASCEERI